MLEILNELNSGLTTDETESVKKEVMRLMRTKSEKKREQMFKLSDPARKQTLLHIVAGKFPDLWPQLMKRLPHDSKGEILNLKDSYGSSPLAIAAEQGNENMFMEMLNEGADPDCRALHCFCRHFCSQNCASILEAMLSKGLDVNTKASNGNTALHCAIDNKREDLIHALHGSSLMTELLINHGALVNERNNRGASPLDWCLYLDKEKAARLLIAFGAEMDYSIKDEKRDAAFKKNHRTAKLVKLAAEMKEGFRHLQFVEGEDVASIISKMIQGGVQTIGFDNLNKEHLHKMNITHPQNVDMLLAVKDRIGGSMDIKQQGQPEDYFLVGECLIEPFKVRKGHNLLGRKNCRVTDKEIGKKQIDILSTYNDQRSTFTIRTGEQCKGSCYLQRVSGKRVELTDSAIDLHEGDRIFLQENAYMLTLVSSSPNSFSDSASLDIMDWLKTTPLTSLKAYTSVSREEERRLDYRLLQYKLRRKVPEDAFNIQENSNSLFYAISDQLTDSWEDAELLRQEAITWLSNNPNFVLPSGKHICSLLPGNLSWKDYCHVLQQGGWGDGLSLVAICESKGVPATIITSVPGPAFVVMIRPTKIGMTRSILLSQASDLHFTALSHVIEDPHLADFGFAIDKESLALGEAIGQGSSGEVFTATWNNFPVCVKKITAHLMTDQKREDFQRETQILGKLRHPNILLFMGTVEINKDLFIVTELMANGSLKDLLAKTGKLPWWVIPKMALDIAQGMSYLHNHRPAIIHRDLKSANVLVDKAYNLKIGDFGLAKFFPKEYKISKAMCSTIVWCSPEVLKDQGYTGKADVYAFGLILWTLFTAEEPFKDLHEFRVIQGLMAENLRPDIPGECPPPYAALMQQCWAENAQERPDFTTISERLNALQQGLESSSEDLQSVAVTLGLMKQVSFSESQSSPEAFRMAIPNMTISPPSSTSESQPLFRSAPAQGSFEREASQGSSGTTSPGSPGSPTSALSSPKTPSFYLKSLSVSENNIPTKEEVDAPKPVPLRNSSALRKKKPVLTVDDAPPIPSSLTSATGPEHWWKLDPNELQYNPDTDEIGSGASATVYKGTYRAQTVAIKILHTNKLDYKEFEKELSIFQQLRSPDILFFYGAFVTPQCGLVTEFLSRGTLMDVMEDPKFDFTWDTVFSFSIQIVEALGRLHSWKPVVVHRDIKSKNLLVDQKCNVKIADLGLARFTTFDNQDTLFKAKGSFAYMAPEVWNDSKTSSGSRAKLGFTPKSDVYSFSVVLWVFNEELH
eukprot:TRINITY_DN6570_c0_g1_i2.p1 TRINITY_DN6570_c0_g1~~TRINITY_DN6570_c0_g1_i2.p1  ORF type:complete len:1355 (+),score=350.46 TRINITY_DN6570_c0_g1_i2:292-4065(+)